MEMKKSTITGNEINLIDLCKKRQEDYVRQIEVSKNPDPHIEFLENMNAERTRFEYFLKNYSPANPKYNRKPCHWQSLFSKLILKAWDEFKTNESYMQFN